MINLIKELLSKSDDDSIIHDQDNAWYWNVKKRVLSDTAYMDEEYSVKEDSMVDIFHEWCLKNNISMGSSIIEIGCGGGRMLMIWNECNYRYQWDFNIHGLEHSEKAIEIAQKRNPETEFICQGAEENFGIEKYDVVYTHTCIQHNSGWKYEKIIPNIYNALKDQGHLFMGTEKTFANWETGDYEFLKKDPFYCDERKSSGTAAWWVNKICKFRFELIEFYHNIYTFRKIS